MIPHRAEIEGLLGDGYRILQRRLQSLTFREDILKHREVSEADLATLREALLPIDSVQSARIDGMPHAQAAMVSDPTVRIVLSREAIDDLLDRRTGPAFQLEPGDAAELEAVLFCLRLSWDIWGELRPWERRLLELWYWDHQSKESISKAFDREMDKWLSNPVPRSGPEVKREHRRILLAIEQGYRELWDRVAVCEWLVRNRATQESAQ